MRFIFLCLAFLLTRSALAAPDDARKIVGVWKLVSVLYEDQQTNETWPVLGAHPRGSQVATAKGRWVAVVTGEGRKVPQNDAERADALRSMIAYSGKYRVEDGKVTTRVEAAWQESWVGGDQVRFIRFEGENLLRIDSPPMPHPNLAGRVVRVIVTWEREE